MQKLHSWLYLSCLHLPPFVHADLPLLSQKKHFHMQLSQHSQISILPRTDLLWVDFLAEYGDKSSAETYHTKYIKAALPLVCPNNTGYVTSNHLTEVRHEKVEQKEQLCPGEFALSWPVGQD